MKPTSIQFRSGGIFACLAFVAIAFAYFNLQKQIAEGFRESRQLQYSSHLLNPVQWDCEILADSKEEKILVLRSNTTEPHELILRIDDESWRFGSRKDYPYGTYKSKLCVLIDRVGNDRIKLSFNTDKFKERRITPLDVNSPLDAHLVNLAIGGVSAEEACRIFLWDDGSTTASIWIDTKTVEGTPAYAE